MRLSLAVLLSMLPLSAYAGAEGSWPPEARGMSQPRPSWVLVVPASRDRSGGIVAWDRAGPWMRKWVVPKPAKGDVRTVAVTGDSEDARLVDGAQLDNMDTSALRALASKYGAPAVALVVEGTDGDVAVAAWSRGGDATWDTTMPGEDARDGALRVIGELFGGGGGGGSGRSGSRVTITGVRTIDGFDQYRLEMRSEADIDMLRGLPGISVIEEHRDGKRPWVVARTTDGRMIEDVLGAMRSRD